MRGLKVRQVAGVPVRQFYESCRERLGLQLVAGETGLGRIISEKSVNRPALALTGYFRYFAARRLQLFGAGEMAYLRDQEPARQREILRAMAELDIPCMVISRNFAPTRTMIAVAREYDIPLLRTTNKSRDFSAQATLVLEEHFSPSVCMHATLLDIKGIGTLLRGRSGVGKSECALALIENGHSLVSDDVTYIRRVGDTQLLGRSGEINRGYMECRGIGIINIAELFGVRAVRLEKRIDFVITFVDWVHGMEEERTGLDQEYMEILDLKVPHMEMHVRPGRDMARLVEVACRVQALRSMGHNSAQEFNERLIKNMIQRGQHDSEKRL